MASALTEKQLQELRRRLEEERIRILRVLRTPTSIPPQPDQETELEEVAQRETERAHRVEIAERERALLAEVERALAKVDRGDYGVSEKTGEPIPYRRLAAVPWAREDVGE
jgi:DnaK suppressor protein